MEAQQTTLTAEEIENALKMIHAESGDFVRLGIDLLRNHYKDDFKVFEKVFCYNKNWCKVILNNGPYIWHLREREQKLFIEKKIGSFCIALFWSNINNLYLVSIGELTLINFCDQTNFFKTNATKLLNRIIKHNEPNNN